MKMFARVMSLMLAVAMLAITAVSCGSGKTEEPAATTTAANDVTTEATTTAAVETTKDPNASDLPDDLNYNGETINIISRDSDWVRDEIWVEQINGDVVNDAVYQRNAVVEERLGVKINNMTISGTDNYAVADEVRVAVKAGSDEYDLLANSVYSSIMYSAENIFHNLYNCDYLDLEKPYWAQGFNQAASFGQAQYMCTGAAALTLYRYMFVTFFNKSVLSEVTDTNLYEVVNQGKWTLDYQHELASKFFVDLNGNGQSDATDRYGFVCTNMAYIDAYWSSCQLPILTKDENNAYVYNVDLEKVSAAVDKILNLWYNCEGSYIFESVSDAENQLIGTRAIAERRAATTTLRLVSVETDEFRNMTDLYGIIPIPKMDETQEGYQTFLHDQFTAFGIVSTVKEDRLQMMGAFLEAMAEESYRTLVPTYYELALKTKYVSDEESGQMLDMIYRSVYIDAGVLYTKTVDVHQQLRAIIRSGNNNVASMFKATSKIAEKMLDKMNDSLWAIQ
jgi:hypothetical protein